MTGPTTPCIEWLGARTKRGYGRKSRNGKQVYAHVDALEQATGAPIPEGLEVDHLCRNPPCYNPDHLEAVTHAENMARWGATFTHCPAGHAYPTDGPKVCRTCKNARRNTGCWTVAAGHCPKGHEFTPENTKREGNSRRCITCAREHKRAYKARQKERADA